QTMQLTQRQINYCMECGVCTGSCPVSYEWDDFSPRQIIKRTLIDEDESFLGCRELWACLSCARCSTRCPVAIDFPEFIRTYRNQARRQDFHPQESHHGVLQTITALQTADIQQRRTDWTRDVGSIKDSGDVFYFVGCLPYFESAFSYLHLSPLDSARSILTLLNSMGIEPVVSDEERCCGHDPLWSGNEDIFRKLAKINMDLITGSGAKTVLFGCPEGYLTFKRHYAQEFGPLPFEVLHVTEFLARELPQSGLNFQAQGHGPVTYHDPCRLGRWLGIYEQPRQVLGHIKDLDLREMDRNRENATCCGTSAWMECSSCSRAMQWDRLQEAAQTGAGTLITSCPKCQIHFTCAKETAGVELDIMDIYAYLNQCLK
ncbi:MAG: (Fe-S)-binding protein, partial [Desulfovermiculus sp.]